MNLPGRTLAFAVTSIALTSGCALYRPVPIDATGADDAARSDWQHAPQAAAAAVHPRLPPLQIDPAGPWSDLEVAALAVVASPAMKALRAQVGVADAQVFSAGLLPDPQLSLALDHPTTPGYVNGYTAGLGVELGALLARSAERGKASAAAEQMRASIAWQEWQGANQVRVLVRRMNSLRRQLAVATPAAETSQSMFVITERAVHQGDAKLDDLALRRVAVMDARDRSKALERQIESTRLALELAAGVGAGQDLPLRENAALHDPQALDTTSLSERALHERLDLMALRHGYDSQEADVRRAILGQFPLPTLNLSRGRDTSDVYSSGAGLTLSLPLWNRNRGAIAVARATREQLRLEYAARAHEARGAIAAQVEDLRQLADERRMLDEQVDALRGEVEILRAAAERGDVPLINYESARASLLDKQLAALGLEQAQYEGEVALELAVGALIWN